VSPFVGCSLDVFNGEGQDSSAEEWQVDVIQLAQVDEEIRMRQKLQIAHSLRI